MAVDARTKSDSERLVTMETRMDTFVTCEQYERDQGDIKVMLANLRGDIATLRSDIKNLTWQIAVIVAILSSIISFLVSRIPI